MSGDSVTTQRVDYLQRSGSEPHITSGPRTEGGADGRRLLRIRAIGRPAKLRPRPTAGSERWRPPTAELITGLYGYRIPVAFQLLGSPDGVRVALGTWSARAASPPVQQRRLAVIESVLRGLYPVVDVEPANIVETRWPLAGVALGVPSPAGIDDTDGAAPIDRVVRSMTGANWSILVLAYPAAEPAIAEVRDSVLNEMRAVQSAAKSELAPSPLTEQYVELLKTSLATAGEAMATGAWRTAAYLLGDEESYPRLASAWRSVMSGEGSLPEPVRVFDRPEVDELARSWALPDDPGAAAPGFYRRPFEYQTLLSTAQLASYVHLPEIEAPGFSVNLVPRFDVVASANGADSASVSLGNVLQHRRATAGTYGVSLKSLTRHVFVAGLTGSGKTNTIMSLLEEAGAHGVPFMVIEPAKAEYRALIDHPRLGPLIRVFTAGKSMVSPFVVNPFEVPTGTTVSEHLNLLRAAFTAGFGMWTPLPQILERCLHEIYADRGWDLRTDTNTRLSDQTRTPGSFPTLSDL